MKIADSNLYEIKHGYWLSNYMKIIRKDEQTNGLLNTRQNLSYMYLVGHDEHNENEWVFN